MITSKLIAARIAYGVDRAVQANADTPVAVKAWDSNTAVHVTWLQYVSAWQQSGTSPDLDSGGIRDDAFAAVMAVVSPRRLPGQVAGRTASFTLSPTTTTKAAAATQQLTVSAAADYNGDAVSSETYSYASSDTGVATVSATGLITAVATGTCTVTVTASSGVTRTCAVTVS